MLFQLQTSPEKHAHYRGPRDNSPAKNNNTLSRTKQTRPQYIGEFQIYFFLTRKCQNCTLQTEMFVLGFPLALNLIEFDIINTVVSDMLHPNALNSC